MSLVRTFLILAVLGGLVFGAVKLAEAVDGIAITIAEKRGP